MPAHYTFHYVNGWEDKNEKGEPIVVVYGCATDFVDIALDVEHPFLDDGKNKNELTKFIFNLETGEAQMKTMVEGLSCEFPIVNQKYIGSKNRYTYIAYFFNKLPNDKAG